MPTVRRPEKRTPPPPAKPSRIAPSAPEDPNRPTPGQVGWIDVPAAVALARSGAGSYYSGYGCLHLRPIESKHGVKFGRVGVLATDGRALSCSTTTGLVSDPVSVSADVPSGKRAEIAVKDNGTVVATMTKILKSGEPEYIKYLTPTNANTKRMTDTAGEVLQDAYEAPVRERFWVSIDTRVLRNLADAVGSSVVTVGFRFAPDAADSDRNHGLGKPAIVLGEHGAGVFMPCAPVVHYGDDKIQDNMNKFREYALEAAGINVGPVPRKKPRRNIAPRNESGPIVPSPDPAPAPEAAPELDGPD